MGKINSLLDFINKNENWKDLIQQEPFNISVKEEGDYTLLKYNQVESDFNKAIVNCCRGIILNKDNKIVCFPFYKFFNYGEVYADTIDWNSAKILEKIDGSIIKVWFDKEWHISTNGSINAFGAPLADNNKTFGDLFMEVFPKELFSKLNIDNTYMFELVSPENQIVVNYPKTDLYHIGTRNNITFKEIEEDIGIKKPKSYSFNNLEELVSFTKTMTQEEEGFVVVDKDYNRIKVKSAAYVLAHHTKGNSNFNTRKIIEFIKNNELSEILAYFPNLQDKISVVQKQINLFIAKVYTTYANVLDIKDKKDLVFYLKDNYPPSVFPFVIKLYENPNINMKIELLKLSADRILSIIE